MSDSVVDPKSIPLATLRLDIEQMARKMTIAFMLTHDQISELLTAAIEKAARDFDIEKHVKLVIDVQYQRYISDLIKDSVQSAQLVAGTSQNKELNMKIHAAISRVIRNALKEQRKK